MTSNKQSMTDDELRDAVAIMRQRASRVGPQHAFWDLIFDCEALLKGMDTAVPREQVERAVMEALSESKR